MGNKGGAPFLTAKYHRPKSRLRPDLRLPKYVSYILPRIIVVRPGARAWERSPLSPNPTAGMRALNNTQLGVTKVRVGKSFFQFFHESGRGFLPGAKTGHATEWTQQAKRFRQPRTVGSATGTAARDHQVRETFRIGKLGKGEAMDDHSMAIQAGCFQSTSSRLGERFVRLDGDDA